VAGLAKGADEETEAERLLKRKKRKKLLGKAGAVGAVLSELNSAKRAAKEADEFLNKPKRPLLKMKIATPVRTPNCAPRAPGVAFACASPAVGRRARAQGGGGHTHSCAGAAHVGRRGPRWRRVGEEGVPPPTAA